MNRRIMFRHMKHSDAIEQHALQQLKKIENFLENEPSPCSIDLVMEPSKIREHPKVELRIKTPHYDLITHYEQEGMDFYQVLDHVIDVMYRLLHEEKQKLVDARKHRSKQEKAFEYEQEEFEESEYEDDDSNFE